MYRIMFDSTDIAVIETAISSLLENGWSDLQKNPVINNTSLPRICLSSNVLG